MSMEACEECDGEGTIECLECGTQNAVDCDVCDGTGEVETE